jgi:nucleotide-binding universal stress UspA family protein
MATTTFPSVTHHVGGSSALRLGRIVIGVDFSDRSMAAAEWTVRHFAPAAQHILTHAIDLPPSKSLIGGFPRRVEIVRRASEGALNRLRNAREEWLAPGMRLDVREGTPAQAITTLASDTAADLIVVGEHTHGRTGWLAPGSTADLVLETASVPVLVARGRLEESPRRILAAVHDATDAPAVLAWSRRLASQFDARVTVCHVFRPVFAGVAEQVAGGTRWETELAQHAQTEAWLDARLRDAGFEHGEADIEVLMGGATNELLSAQQRAEFGVMVVGSRRVGPVMRALLGSVTQTMMREAACPVLVTKAI